MKIPAAREEFGLGDGVWFDNHANALDDVGLSGSDARPSRPDQFCIHRVDGQSNTLLTTIEYKPPHKLSVQTIREGLRPMDFWQEIVKPDTIPTDGPERQRYNAARLAGSVAVQQFHGMIQYGVGCSSITNGLTDVQLWVPFDDPTTLYYDVGDPDIKRHADVRNVRGPRTRVERALCTCLMSFRTPLRDQAWRNAAKARLPIWHTSFDSERSRIPAAELPQDANVDYTSSEYTSPEQGTSEYSTYPHHLQRDLLSPKAVESPHEQRLAAHQHPISIPKRIPRILRSTLPHLLDRSVGSARLHRHLQANAPHPEQIPKGTEAGNLAHIDVRHPISVEDLVKKLKTQLDQDLDHNCTPIGPCGSYGAPFKISCATFGYTIVAKGTTSKLWKEVSREAEVYRVLQRAQGSANPVFLGAINLAQIYFLHGAGEIRHMLLMGWGGERVGHTTLNDTIQRAISRSVKEIRSLGVFHQDLHPDNVLWNAELKRALIIDFHRCTLNRRPMHKRPRSLKRLQCRTEERESKRERVGSKSADGTGRQREIGSVIIPALLYGCSAWHTLKPDGEHLQTRLRSLNKIHTKAMLAIAGVYRATATAALNIETYQLPVQWLLEKQMLETLLWIATSKAIDHIQNVRGGEAMGQGRIRPDWRCWEWSPLQRINKLAIRRLG
ncbi:hypothetical protein KXV92_007261 [Aspergillus fumigatus]|nr:hypothetical protein KXV92_007261 [Aspergillus fumigatus]KAJ8225803.1 hypothetical protein LV156_009087 [Aspergillus fumigatus]KAJ8227721.1 hypothetical protein LV160_009033 [Aspergillus fumigatus]